MIPFLPASRLYVEELQIADADSLVEIHAQGFARPWSADDFASLVADRHVTALGLRRQSAFGLSRLIAFVLVRSVADEGEILTIAVRSTQRGRGHGRRLMEEVLRKLYRERIGSCFLEVDSDNAAAVALYRSLGFERVGERKGYYDRVGAPAGAALVMRLRLR
jgi:[ribosomal protein S18]-alanine N-acetyltransferase